MKNHPKKILLLGPCTNKKDPEMTSGTVVFFDGLIKQFKENHIDFTIIDTNKKNYFTFFLAYISIFFQILFKHKGCSHISLHSSRDYMVLGVIVILIGKLFGKRTSIRKFGGEAVETYIKSKGIKRWVLKFIFTHIDTLFLQTKYLVDFYSKINKRTFLFPNVRHRVIAPELPRNFKKKFVFISGVRHEKGIDEIIESSKQLDSSYTIDIYGPILDAKYSKEYFQKNNVSYQGALEVDAVLPVLNKYDVLMLPSYYPGEGYPGIIIEAYSLGIPVIATSLQGIKEIVEVHKTGIIVEPKSVEDLMRAIEYFNKENYSNMSENAYRKFDDFQFDKQTKLFLDRL